MSSSYIERLENLMNELQLRDPIKYYYYDQDSSCFCVLGLMAFRAGVDA